MKKECVICGFNKRVESHHIIKHRDLGSDDEANLVFLCPNHHWIADFGEEADREFILNQIIKITGKSGCKIEGKEKDIIFKKARRLVEESLGKYSDEDWDSFNMEGSFNFITTVRGLRGRAGWDGDMVRENHRRAELLLIRDKIDEALGYKSDSRPVYQVDPEVTK